MNRSLSRFTSCLILLLLLSGCASNSRKVALPSPTVVDRSPPQTQTTSSSVEVDTQRIVTLLAEAEQAMADKRLTTPKHYNAWSFYQRVLKLQPYNQEAKQGLEAIVQRYLGWSRNALQAGKVKTAQNYLWRAAKVNPHHPDLKQAKSALESKSSVRPVVKPVAKQPPSTVTSTVKASTDKFIPLSPAAVKAKSKSTRQQLAKLADRIKVNNARVIIEAPSDGAGRWIYQQLNGRHEEYRIRANMRIKSQPAIRLLY